MLEESISIISINQLKDNYCYLIRNNNSVIILDPSESEPIIEFIKKNNLIISAILITHHHNDHTAGIKNILNYNKVPVYSPNKNIIGTSSLVKDGDILNFGFINFKIFETPGHTLDHVVYYNQKNNILFSADLIFRLGCGRIFEGTYKQMYNSLMKLNNLSNETKVYCGHEYTISNLNFLLSIFPDQPDLLLEKINIEQQILNTGTSVPFNLGKEKTLNPFLSSNSKYYQYIKNQRNLNDFEFFAYVRDLKNSH